MRLCVFGRDDDPLTMHTAERARARGHEVLVVPLAELVSGAPVAFDLSSWIFRGDALEGWDAFVVRQYPAPHALLAPPESTHTAREYFQRGVVHQERSSFAQSLIMDLERRGKPMVNPLFASQHWDHKPLQLAALERAGVPIPRTVVTNLPAAARAFVDAIRAGGGACIVKPSAGGAETRAVDDALYGQLDAIASAPVIVQERIDGPDVRATVVGDRVVSSVIIESDTLDYRAGDAYRRGDARYVAHALPDEVARMCVEIARMFSHVLSGIDLKRTQSGYVVLEANSGPVYLDIEKKTGAPITDAIVEHLERALQK